MKKLHAETLTEVRIMIASNGSKMQYILRPIHTTTIFHTSVVSDHISIVSEKTELFVY